MKKEKTSAPVGSASAQNAEELMRKFDKESNTRIWVGKPAVVVKVIAALFSLYSIYSTLFSVAALEKRLTLFLAMIIVVGYLYYPVSRHHVRENTLPWYDILLMLAGAGCFLYYNINYD